MEDRSCNLYEHEVGEVFVVEPDAEWAGGRPGTG